MGHAVMRFLGGTVAALAALAAPAAAAARDVTVRSFDGTKIAAHFFPAKGLGPDGRAPTVLIGHGYGGTGDANAEGGGGPTSPGRLRSEGYNVLTWDARGFGQSGGSVQVDHRDYEGRDVQALLDYVANQPEARLDGPGDPRVGMGGGSYGGAIQLVTAAIDRRVDAIAPQIAWSDLVRSLYQHATVKAGWGALLTGVGATATTGGVLAPAGPELGSTDSRITIAAAEGTSSGRFSDESVRWFADRSTAPLVPRVRVPTLIFQGTVDTLFTLREAIDNFGLLKGTGVPVKMLWFCGGHGTCLGESGNQAERQLKAVLAWYARYLKNDTSVDTGPVFEWVTDTDGSWYESEVFPLPQGGSIRAAGSGTLPLTPGTTSGQVIAATPSEVAVNVDIPAPGSAVHVVGEPKLRLTYSGSGAPAEGRVYAQLVDVNSGRVVGNQVTPLPVGLDGQEHTVEFGLEPVAARLDSSSRWRLQLAPGSNVYDVQRSSGALEIVRAELELPTVAVGRRASLALGRPRGLRRARRGRPARVRVRAHLEPYSGARVRLLRRVAGRWIPVGRTRRLDLGVGARALRIRVPRRLARGVYMVVLSATDQYGRSVRLERRIRLRRR